MEKLKHLKEVCNACLVLIETRDPTESEKRQSTPLLKPNMAAKMDPDIARILSTCNNNGSTSVEGLPMQPLFLTDDAYRDADQHGKGLCICAYESLIWEVMLSQNQKGKVWALGPSTILRPLAIRFQELTPIPFVYYTPSPAASIYLISLIYQGDFKEEAHDFKGVMPNLRLVL